MSTTTVALRHLDYAGLTVVDFKPRCTSAPDVTIRGAAILPSLMAKLSGGVFAFPIESVVEIVRFPDGSINTVQGTSTVRGRVNSVVRLDDLFTWNEGPSPAAPAATGDVTMVILGSEGRELGLRVDRLIGEAESRKARIMAVRLLIVDDAMIIRELIKEAAAEAGFQVAGEAANGQEAIERFQELRPDVVTLDLVMPKFDGLYALEGILATDPRAKVIVVSALEPTAILKDAFRKGATDFITKPFDKKLLVATIRSVLGVGTVATAS